jgi:hypothetical protein
MSNPWDSLPFPTSGDSDDRLTYEGVGRVMSEWEGNEFELARLHSVFLGDPDGDAAISSYGKGRIFQERIRILREAAERYFSRHPNQTMEGNFERLAVAAEGFADRRNEVAHGYVLPMNKMLFFMHQIGLPVSEVPLYALVPPLHTIRWHKEGLPKYAYTSSELRTLSERLLLLLGHVHHHRMTLLGQ